MTNNYPSAGGFDVNESSRLVADLPYLLDGQRCEGGAYSGYWADAEVWQRTFSTAIWVDATPGGPQVDPIDPGDIDEVVIASVARGNNGRAVAILRAGQRWIGIESRHDDTLGTTLFSAGRAHVADRLAAVLQFGIGEWEHEDLGLPTEIDAAMRWANRIEDGRGTSLTRLLDWLGEDRAPWSAAFNEFLATFEMRWNGGSAFHPTEVAGVLTSAHQPDDMPRSMAALLRLHDGAYASLSFEFGDRFGGRFAEPVIHQDRAVVIAEGFSPAQRTAFDLGG